MRTLKYVHTLQDNVFILLIPEGISEDQIQISAKTENLDISFASDWRDETIIFELGHFIDLDGLQSDYGSHNRPGFQLKAFKQEFEISAYIDVEDHYTNEQLLDAAEMGYVTFTAENNVEVIDEICTVSDWLYPVESENQQISNFIFCPNCGKKFVQSTASFCSECGSKLNLD
ncbi:zinc ribbon domain-containing protein [Aurantimicrobium minutum]|uniref:Putative zinc-ribbon domain-containing protein n=1 Tax=Aurantimicrobium minutum TaxID=708131 RepID=A0A173LXV4_9MICO|nr:zinc ribbon domain-containing protein [Aurantimicrobium minutum]BAU99682.1 Uncharacterized protein AUMI_111400 [Aurantimicrobium minutum]